jgi:hypothetical protein
MNEKTGNIIHRLTIPFILLVVIWASSNINWEEHRRPRIIKVDGNGYYAYLPAIFIYHDLHFGFFDEIAKREGYQNMAYEYRYTYKGDTVNKYFAGTSLAQLPFFLMAHGISLLAGLPADGYSGLYLIFINLATIFYLFIACYFLDKFLKLHSISPLNRVIVLLTIVFGTNVYYYTVYEPSMSHIYSLAFTTMFVYFVTRFVRSHDSRFIILSSALLGMITLIRPANLVIILAVPFLSGSFSELKEAISSLLKKPLAFCSGLIVFLGIISIQLAIYKIQTGHFFVYSYGGERFYLAKPHLGEILFSYRKGLFIYTPVLLVSLAGLYFIYKESRYRFISFLVFFFILTWLLSSWHQWYYGGSFSERVYIEYYVLFALLMAGFLHNLKNRTGRIVYISILGLLVIVCIIQTYQYYFGHIHWSDMTGEKYWDVFLRIDRLLN